MKMPAVCQVPGIEYSTFDDIKETRPVILITSDPAWEAVKSHLLKLPVVWKTDVRLANLTAWRQILDQITLLFSHSITRSSPVVTAEVVYAVGGGMVVDAGKYVACELDLPLICLPTALSVDAFFTSGSTTHENGIVKSINTKAPDKIVVDFGAIASAPLKIRSTGICEVLSIATAAWDWEFAESKGMNTPETAYIPYAAQVAKSILQGALDCADVAGRGDMAGLKQLLDCMAMEVQLCNLLGHSRPQKGSEHYFAYAVENELEPSVPYGDLVGSGILIMAEIQGQDITTLWRALEASHVNIHRIPSSLAEATLQKLPDYVRQNNLPFGIAHTLSSSQVISLEDLLS